MDLGQHILLVDEDGFRRRDHAFLLQISGFDVHTVKSPMEALNWLSISRTACHPCDLILMVGCAGLHEDRKVFDAVKEAGALVPLLLVDRDPKTGMQVVWRKPAGKKPRISFHKRPRMIADIVRAFFWVDMGKGDANDCSPRDDLDDPQSRQSLEREG